MNKFLKSLKIEGISINAQMRMNYQDLLDSKVLTRISDLIVQLLVCMLVA